MHLKRRAFLKTLTHSAAASVCVPTLISREVLGQNGTGGANDRIGIAGIGVGRRGREVFLDACRQAGAQAVCACDAFLPRAESVARQAGLTESEGTCGWVAIQDYRKVLDRKDVDAIVTATPEHWRSLICVNAALAGKHIYAEKPMSLTVSEGRLMVKAARKMKVTFQVGSMQRSMRENRIGCDFIQRGGLGKIQEVVAANYESPWLAALPEDPIPAGLDWDLWCGPTEPVPFNREIFTPRGNPGWLSFRPYSGGEMTGWGTHGLDQIQLALGMQETGPVEILVEGGALVPPCYEKPEDRNRGNALCGEPRLSFTYANGIRVWLGKPDGTQSNRGGAIFYGEKGKMEIFRANLTSNPAEMAQDLLKNSPIQGQSHTRNWLDCIRSGETPIDDCEFGHRTASLCHILNAARYLGRSLKWDPAAEEFVGDAEANSFLSREHRKGFELPNF